MCRVRVRAPRFKLKGDVVLDLFRFLFTKTSRQISRKASQPFTCVTNYFFSYRVFVRSFLAKPDQGLLFSFINKSNAFLALCLFRVTLMIVLQINTIKWVSAFWFVIQNVAFKCPFWLYLNFASPIAANHTILSKQSTKQITTNV